MKVQTVGYVDGRWSAALPREADSPNTLVLLFGNPLAAIDEVIKNFPSSKIIGCSTAGEIHDTTAYVNTLTVSIVQFQKAKLRVETVPYNDYEKSFDVGQQLFQKLNAPDLQGLLVFGQGFMNGDQFSRGLTQDNTRKVTIAGGLAGDPAIKDTWVIGRDGISREIAIGLGFYGENIEFLVSTVAGVTPIGIERTVTRATKNTLYEVDGQSALSFYEEFLGEKVSTFEQLAVQYPVGISKDYKINASELIRTPFGVNKEDRSITFTGEIPIGSKIRLMIAATDNLIEGSEAAAKSIFEQHKDDKSKECLLIPISCLTRKFVLGSFLEDELESIREQFQSERFTINGFYSFGEIATDQQGTCSLHNQSMNLVCVSEK